MFFIYIHIHIYVCPCIGVVCPVCLTLCNPMDCRMPGLPVSHHHLKFAQVHVHCIIDDTQPSHPLIPSSPILYVYVCIYTYIYTYTVGLWRRLSAKELMLLNCGVGEDSWESLGLQGDPTSPFWRRSALGFLWKEWC